MLIPRSYVMGENHALGDRRITTAVGTRRKLTRGDLLFPLSGFTLPFYIVGHPVTPTPALDAELLIYQCLHCL